jgi:hypothetical protein
LSRSLQSWSRSPLTRPLATPKLRLCHRQARRALSSSFLHQFCIQGVNFRFFIRGVCNGSTSIIIVGIINNRLHPWLSLSIGFHPQWCILLICRQTLFNLHPSTRNHPLGVIDLILILISEIKFKTNFLNFLIYKICPSLDFRITLILELVDLPNLG